MDGDLLYEYIGQGKPARTGMFLDASARQQIAPARAHRFYTKNAQTKPMPVHSRDAACPRPAYPRKMRKQNQCPSIVGTLLARVLRTHEKCANKTNARP